MAKVSGNVIEGSFHIEQEVEFNSARQKVWAALLDVQGWWSHHYGDSTVRMMLEPWVGGRFWQDWGAREGVAGAEHGSPAQGSRQAAARERETGVLFGTVTEIKPPERIRLMGQLGMVRLPVTSVYTWELSEKDGGRRTVLKLTHRAIGLIDETWHKSHEDGWGELWGHLRRLVEEGRRYDAE